ncbi:DHBP synthase RibB-like alpha/beta domain-containing protein [Pilobolus umbonatus]|nr:DHBP synthase RibB-like alpha/beta domain-containing protein [Pilobolus umbonatus]
MFQTKLSKVNPTHFKFNLSKCEFPEQNASCTVMNKEDEMAINTAVEWLKKGEAIGIPTETVYGLAANALNATAVSKIFTAKNRPQDNPLIVHISSIDMLKSLLPDQIIPPIYLPIIHKYWPGPLTIILPTTASIIPPSVTCGHTTVGIRFPSHPVARCLIERCGFPLAAPSANSSGKPSPTLASHVLDDLQGRIPFILDAGACDVGVESTVLDGLRQPPAILRPGGLTYEALRNEMKGLQVYRKHFVDKELEMAPTTPGMKYRHYSPEAMVILIEHKNSTRDSAFNVKFDTVWKQQLTHIQQQGVRVSKVGFLRTTEEGRDHVWESTNLLDNGVQSISLQMGRQGHPEEIARGMFKGLRELDSRSVDIIFVEGISEDREGMAVMNRLRKAASKTIEI